MIFSWAEHKSGMMVHVDNVAQGLACDCCCPKCRERLLARHGNIRHHGFAHHSETRGANLRICYMVTLYKLAEQIVLQKKKIYAPSYYGIFKERIIDFVEVRVDGRYDRMDKQPDIVASTSDGKQFLIEFTFDYKVQRKTPIDCRNLNCLEIDLSGQTLETLENFLIDSYDCRRWLNNQDYFEAIESRYKEKNKIVRVKDVLVCSLCKIKRLGCTVMIGMHPLTIRNGGREYRLCKAEGSLGRKTFLPKIDDTRHTKELENFDHVIEGVTNVNDTDTVCIRDQHIDLDTSPEQRTCFMCKYNLEWMCRNQSVAHCGAFISMGVPQNTPPETARKCNGFKFKNNSK